METIKCPYCECKVLMSDVEDEDGVCPECGAPLLVSLMMNEFAGADDTDDDSELGLDADSQYADDDEDIDLDDDDLDDDDRE